METVGYSVFETALGWFGLAWSDRGVMRSHLPGMDRDATTRRLTAGITASRLLPAQLTTVEDRIRAYGGGERVDFTSVSLDLGGVEDAFRLAIYDVIRMLPYGETVTYGALAEKAGFAGAARQVGQAMGRNPIPLIIPCHRVVAAGGKTGGFSAPGGADSKLRLLTLERARPQPGSQAAFAF